MKAVFLRGATPYCIRQQDGRNTWENFLSNSFQYNTTTDSCTASVESKMWFDVSLTLCQQSLNDFKFTRLGSMTRWWYNIKQIICPSAACRLTRRSDQGLGLVFIHCGPSCSLPPLIEPCQPSYRLPLYLFIISFFSHQFPFAKSFTMPGIFLKAGCCSRFHHFN